MQNESWNLDDELKKNPPPAVIWMKVESSLHLNNFFLPTLLEVIEVKVPRSWSVSNKSQTNFLHNPNSRFQQLSSRLLYTAAFDFLEHGSVLKISCTGERECSVWILVLLCCVGKVFAWKWEGKLGQHKNIRDIRVFAIFDFRLFTDFDIDFDIDFLKNRCKIDVKSRHRFWTSIRPKCNNRWTTKITHNKIHKSAIRVTANLKVDAFHQVSYFFLLCLLL